MNISTVKPSSFYISEIQVGPRVVAYRPNSEIPRVKIPSIKGDLKQVKKLKVLDYHVYFTASTDAKNAVFNSLQKNLNPDYCETTQDLLNRLAALKTDQDKVQYLLNSVVLPIMNRDGGSCELVGVKDGTVLIKLKGACGSCPSSTSTIKGLIERMCHEFVSGIKDVVQV